MICQKALMTSVNQKIYGKKPERVEGRQHAKNMQDFLDIKSQTEGALCRLRIEETAATSCQINGRPCVITENNMKMLKTSKEIDQQRNDKTLFKCKKDM